MEVKLELAGHLSSLSLTTNCQKYILLALWDGSGDSVST